MDNIIIKNRYHNERNKMIDPENIKYRQMYFDMNGEIHQETYVYHRQMSVEQQEQYDRMVQDANQMTIFEFLDVQENNE